MSGRSSCAPFIERKITITGLVLCGFDHTEATFSATTVLENSVEVDLFVKFNKEQIKRLEAEYPELRQCCDRQQLQGLCLMVSGIMTITTHHQFSEYSLNIASARCYARDSIHDGLPTISVQRLEDIISGLKPS